MLLKNTAIFTLGEFAGRVGKFLSLYLVASLIAKSEFGSYAFIVSLSMMVVTLFDFGDNTLVLLRLTRVKFSRLLPYFHLAKLMTTLFCGAMLLAIYFAVGRPVGGLYPSVIPAFTAFCVGWDLQTFLGNVQRSRLDFTGEMLSKLISNFGFLILLLAAIAFKARMSVGIALWIQAATLGLAVIYSLSRIWPNLHRLLPPWRHARRGVLAILRIGAPMTLAASVGVLQASIDSLVLGGTSHLDANASFTIAQRLAQMTYLPLGIVVSVSLPYLTQGLRGGKRAIDAWVLNRVFLGLVLAGAVVGQLFVLTGEWLIPLMLGARYDDVARYSQVAALYVIPYYIFPVLTNLLWVMRSVIATQTIYGVSTVVSFVLDLLVISHYGPFGVAWVAVAMNWAVLLCFIGLYRLRTRSWPLHWSTLALGVIATAFVAAPAITWSGASWIEIPIRTTIALGFGTWLGIMGWRRRDFLANLAGHRGV